MRVGSLASVLVAMVLPVVGFSASARAQDAQHEPSIVVHIDSDRPVALFREEPVTAEQTPSWVDVETSDARAYNRVPKKVMHWVRVCDAPCDREMPIHASYRVDGEGIRATRLLRLAGRPGERVIITVDPASSSAFATGVVVSGIGVAGLVAGFALLLTELGDNLVGNHDPQRVSAAAACFGGGGLVGLVGLGLAFGNGHSSATLSVPGVPAAAPPPSPEPKAASVPDRALRGSAWMVPLWSTQF